MRAISTHKRKAEACEQSIGAILTYGHASVFLNTEHMKEMANCTDKNTLADSVVAAKDASEALQNYSRLLESKRKILEGQAEVSAYTFIPSLIFYC